MNRIGSTLAILFLVVSCDGYRNSSYMEQLLIKNNDRIPNAFRNLQEQPGGDNPFIDIIVSYLLRSADIPTAYSNKVSEQCKNDSLLYVEQATIQSLIPGANNWAPRMLESSGKIPLALHAPNGKINIHSYGLFDECLSVRAENENTGKDFRGRYCSVYYVPVLANLTNKNPEEAEKAAMTKLEDRLGSNWINMFEIWKLAKAADAVPQVGDVTLIDLYSFSNGFCLPSSCSAADVRLAIADMVGDFALSGDNKTFISLLTATDDNHCFSQADPTRQFDGPEIAVIVTLSAIAFMVAAATIHQLVRIILKRPVDEKKEGIAVRSLHCFSINYQ